MVKQFFIGLVTTWKSLFEIGKGGNYVSNLVNWVVINYLNILFSILLVIFVLIVWAVSKKLKLADVLEAAFSPFADGIVFGRRFLKWISSPTDDEGHVGVFSATGTGKTYTIGVPTLKKWGGTAFVIDISGDISSNVKRRHRRVFDVTNDSSLPYYIFADIDKMKSDVEKVEGLRKLALMMMPDQLHYANGAERFFNEGGRKILTGSLIALYFQGYDFVSICQTIVRSSWRNLFKLIDDSGSTEAASYINEFEAQKEQDIAGCKSNCDRAVDLFAHSETLAKIVRRPADGEKYIIPSLLEKTSLYICIPDADLKMYAPLVNIITAQVMTYISSRKTTKKSHQILLFLDEFSSFHIDADVVLEALQKYRKKRCRVMIMTQNIADLDRLYGHDTSRSILANMSFKVLLGGLDDPESARYFAEIIGYRRAKKTSYSSSSSGANISSTSTTTSEERQYVIEPADLDRIGRQRMILLHKNLPHSYMKLWKTRRLR